jgi:hypothetical protein
MYFHTCSFISMHRGMRRGSQPRFRRTADFGRSRKVKLRPLAVAAMQVGHARIIVYVIFDVHAVLNAACAHISRARGRNPPWPGLAQPAAPCSPQPAFLFARVRVSRANVRVCMETLAHAHVPTNPHARMPLHACLHVHARVMWT